MTKVPVNRTIQLILPSQKLGTAWNVSPEMNSKSTFKRLARIFHFRHTTQPNRIAKQQTSSVEENKIKKNEKEKTEKCSALNMQIRFHQHVCRRLESRLRERVVVVQCRKNQPPEQRGSETSSWNVTHGGLQLWKTRRKQHCPARVKCANCGGSQTANFQSRADWAHSAVG